MAKYDTREAVSETGGGPADDHNLLAQGGCNFGQLAVTNEWTIFWVGVKYEGCIKKLIDKNYRPPRVLPLSFTYPSWWAAIIVLVRL